jgi:hypothetical protein
MDSRITVPRVAFVVAQFLLLACGSDPGPTLAIVEQPGSQTVTAPAAATFTVTATAAEPMRYQWSRNEQAITGATGASYTLASTAPSDDGAVFTVTVSADSESLKSAPATLHVLAAAVDVKITRQPRDATTTAGSAAAFSVEATGTPPLAYQWYKDGYPIYGAADATFSLVAAQTSDAGSYKVTITDATGQVSSASATLTVIAPNAHAPQIVQQPAGLIVTAGADAVFTVAATGDAPLAYQWAKDGAALPGATAATLTIVHAQVGDAGAYQVSVTNAAGSARSDAVALVVRVPPTVAQQPESQTVLIGGPVTFTVQATGSPTLMYQWLKDGAALAGKTGPTLAIAAAATADAGSYTVEVANGAGKVTSDAAVLTVTPELVAPSVVKGPESVVVTEGAAAAFTVTASGSTPLGYQWKKGQMAIAGATGPTLAFAATTLADTGVYSVVVTNAKGTVTSAPAMLMINPKMVFPPAISAQPESVEIFVSAEAHFTVIATGPALAYQWHSAKKGAIADATSATLTIPGATLADADDYWVVVTNSYGFATSDKATLTVEVVATQPDAPPPDAPSQGVDAAPALTYTVTYDGNANGAGSVPVDTNHYSQGQTVTTLPNSGILAKSGQTFAGWTTNPDTSGPSASHSAGATWTMNARDVTLYAVWIPNYLNFKSSGSAISIITGGTCPTGPFTVPPGVTAISKPAFENCTALTSVAIPSSVTDIVIGSFFGCNDLADITVDPSNPSYSSVQGSLLDKAQQTLVAAPCGLLSYAVPPGVTSIGDAAIAGCIASEVTIPSSVVSIGAQGFSDCTRLKNITIPPSVTSIGASAFHNSGLTSVTIPASVTSLGDFLFDGCHALTAISVDPANPNYSSSAGVLLDKAQTEVREAPGAIASFTIPATVTQIRSSAFIGCSALTTISIPSTVAWIGGSAFACAGLTSVTMLAEAPPELGPGAFDCNTPAANYPIHVPSAAAVTSYDATPVWSGYATRIVTP